MATVKDMSELIHQYWVKKKCLKKKDFEFSIMKKLVKVLYSWVGQINLVNRELIPVNSFFRSSHQSIQMQNEILQLILSN